MSKFTLSVKGGVFLCQIRKDLEERRKISKDKGVEICAQMRYAGKGRKEILQEITENYKASEKTVDNWIKEARPIVAELQREAEAIRARENEAAVVESAKRLNITQERIAEQYAKIAFYDPGAELKEIMAKRQDAKPDEKSEDSILSYGRLIGVKASDAKAALDSLCKLYGYNAPEKSDTTVRNIGPIDYSKYTDEELRIIADLQRKGGVGTEKSA